MENDPTYKWETVYTVNDYYDGPRNGIADYHGKAHAYKCEWDDDADGWSESFLLSPISDEQLDAVMEDWLIWRRYQASFRAKNLRPGDKHPALAVDWPRHLELRLRVEDALQVDEATAIRAIPKFQGTLEPEHHFQVCWRLV